MPKILLIILIGWIPLVSYAVCDKHKQCNTPFQCYEQELCQFRDNAQADIAASLKKLTAQYQAELAATSQALMDKYQAQLKASEERMTQALDLTKNAREYFEKTQADIAVTLEKLTAQHQAALKATTQALMKEYQARLNAFEKAYTKKMAGEAELTRLARESAEKDANETRALLEGLGTSAEKVAKLTDTITVSNQGIEVASIKTTEPIQIQHKTFKVGGYFEKFYAVVFSDDGWSEGALELEIFRPDVHTDSKARGALLSQFTFHSSAWGNGADFQYAEIHQSQNKFIAGYQNHYHSTRLVIWLRGGGTTYHWRSNHPATLLDFEAKSKVVVHLSPDHPNYENAKLLVEVKTEIAPSLNKWHVYPWIESFFK